MNSDDDLRELERSVNVEPGDIVRATAFVTALRRAGQQPPEAIQLQLAAHVIESRRLSGTLPRVPPHRRPALSPDQCIWCHIQMVPSESRVCSYCRKKKRSLDGPKPEVIIESSPLTYAILLGESFADTFSRRGYTDRKISDQDDSPPTVSSLVSMLEVSSPGRRAAALRMSRLIAEASSLVLEHVDDASIPLTRKGRALGLRTRLKSFISNRVMDSSLRESRERYEGWEIFGDIDAGWPTGEVAINAIDDIDCDDPEDDTHPLDRLYPGAPGPPDAIAFRRVRDGALALNEACLAGLVELRSDAPYEYQGVLSGHYGIEPDRAMARITAWQQTELQIVMKLIGGPLW